MDPTTKSPSDQDQERDAERLIASAERILRAIATDPLIDLNEPVDLLALQLLGPALNRATGMPDHMLQKINDTLVDISLMLDIDTLRALLRQKGSPHP